MKFPPITCLCLLINWGRKTLTQSTGKVEHTEKSRRKILKIPLASRMSPVMSNMDESAIPVF